MRSLAAWCLLLLSTSARAEGAVLGFRGYAYDLSTNRFLYTEVHEQKIVGERWLGGTIDYYAPDGSKLGHKTLDFTQDPYVPRYRLDLTARGGYMEGIEALTAERVEMVKKGYGADEVKHKSIKRTQAMAADSGFHVYIRDHFAELMAGQTLNFRFAVAGNLEAYWFRARRLPDTTFEGKPAVRFRVEPDSLLRWLVDPLELTYETTQRRLLEYRGVSNLHDPATGAAYNVHIVYPTQPPADITPLPAQTE
jgi:hypothetical protein